MQLVEVGQISKPKGLDGTVKIHLISSDIQNMLERKTFLVDKKELHVEKSYNASNGFFVKFMEINSIDEAQAIQHFIVEVYKEDLPKLAENERYVMDLIGFEIFLTSGEKIGKLKAVDNYGASDIAIINTRKEELMVPIIDGLIDSFLDDKIIFDEKLYKELTEVFEEEF